MRRLFRKLFRRNYMTHEEWVNRPVVQNPNAGPSYRWDGRVRL